MSSVAIGDAFEARVFEALAEELRNERLCVAPKHAKIFRKKAYHSRDRQAAITTDMSIEVFLPDRERPTLVWVFECKDYTGRVPVDDIEEFHAKLQQIGEDNTKGTFVTSGALQRSALAYAGSKKIGVVRLLPSGQMIVLMELLTVSSFARVSQVDWSEFSVAFSEPGHRSRRGFFASDDGYWFPNWYSLLSHSIRDEKGAV
ncbi:MAG TPA: restriction endonuclease [Pyrinomonadaceae bacterium]|nr:restriction endonuclease [Pyrinomonadaceae bacterium]